MPKRKKLAIFCDGTWNDLRMSERTNVSRLAQCVKMKDDSGRAQIVYYDVGVGVSAGVSRLADRTTAFMGGAFGRGLDYKIEAAYKFLVLNYEPGDDIYIFGFSRGAYVARSLCGLIRKCGILRREHLDKVPMAMDQYRNKLHPADDNMAAFRKDYSHACSAGPEDYPWVDEALGQEGESFIGEERSGETRADLYQYRRHRSYRMMYVGLWDTVGSLGVPDRFRALSHLTKKKYMFHDTEASSLMSSIRHAMAIDEDRRVFQGAPFKNIDELNTEWAKATGWDVANPNNPNFVPYRHRPYQQWWFPGDHGAVGGGNPEYGLSSSALLWIAQGAVDAGLDLAVEPGNPLAEAFRIQNPVAVWRVDKKGNIKKAGSWNFLGAVGGYAGRRGPNQQEEVADTALCRWWRDWEYRPKTLSVLQGAKWSGGGAFNPFRQATPDGFPPRPVGRLSEDPLLPPPAGRHRTML